MDCAHMFKRGRLFTPKIWFTMYYGSLGIIMPYFNVLLAHMGYGARQIGVISILRPLVSGVSGPLLSSTADALSSHHKIFLTALALTSMIRASLGVLATPFTYLISIITVMEISNGPLSALSDSAVMSATKETGDYGYCRFWASVAYNITGIMSSAALTVAGDTAVFIGYAFGAAAAFISACHLSFEKVSRPHRPEDDPESPGAPQARLLVRQHSSGATAPQTVLMDAVAGNSTAPPEPLLATDSPIYHKKGLEGNMHGPHDADDDEEMQDGTRIRAGRPETFWQKLGKALHNPEMILFLSKGLVMGVCVGVIDGFLFVYMDQLGAPPALLGACLLMIGCAELPIFQYSGPILSFLGYSRALHLALGAFCCRLAVYSTMHLMPTLWMVPPFETLHGITFGIAWAAGVNFCQAKAPEGLKSTIQSLFGATYYGLGRGVGGLVGGLMLHHFGGPILFRSVLIWTAGSWGVIAIMEILTGPSEPSTEQR